MKEIGLVPLFNGISTFVGYSKPKLSWSNNSGTIEPIFKGISPKVNVIERLEFELGYYGVAVQHVNHETINEIDRKKNTKQRKQK